MDHPLTSLLRTGVSVDGFRHCRAGHRCIVCRLVLEDDVLGRVIFHLMVTKDRELVGMISRLESLFYDAAV